MNLLGKGNDPKFWSETVRNGECYEAYRKFQFDNWNKLCTDEVEDAFKYTSFRLYAINGDRGVFQGPYYRRRVKLETAVILSLIYPEEEKYLDYAMEMIFAVCNEYSWAIPAHVPNLITVNNRTHLDLFACETAFMLSEVYTLLGERLEPLIRDRIRTEIDKRVINSFLKHENWGWLNCTNNWAAVCAGSIGCTFMLMHPEMFESVKPRLDKAMENYLDGFKDDGFCTEGTHYWHYGFGFFCTYADMLCTFTDGKDNYFEREKVHSIATFIQKMYLSGKKSVSFADAGSSLDYHIGIVHFLKRKYDDVKVYSPEYSYINDGCGRFCWLVRAATWLDEELYLNPVDDTVPAEYFGKDSQWFIKRTQSYGFAAKAGFNNEHHNHNDVGAFIIARNGEHIITDPGSGAYSKQYFSKDTRYTMIECSSLGHSTPYFGDICQKYGNEFAASDLSYDGGVFSFDMAGAYGDERVKHIIRSFEFTDDSIMLTDEFDYSGEAPITERFISTVKPEVKNGTVICGSVAIRYGKEITAVNISEAITSRRAVINLIDFVLAEGESTARFTFE